MTDRTTRVAEALYRSGCLKFGSYSIKSGAQSPYYIDLACLLSSPKDLCIIADLAAEEIQKIALDDKIDLLASIELKGALILPSIACRTNLPCVVVRKEEKTYGATGRTAGAVVKRGDAALFFDDVISEGTSKLEAIRPLEQLGARIENILVVVDRQQRGKENLAKLGYKVHALTEVTQLTDRLLQESRISKEQADAVINYVKNK
jgi:orotate phosphoribosyltransferase